MPKPKPRGRYLLSHAITTKEMIQGDERLTLNPNPKIIILM